jgi:hypothetical protein
VVAQFRRVRWLSHLRFRLCCILLCDAVGDHGIHSDSPIFWIYCTNVLYLLVTNGHDWLLRCSLFRAEDLCRSQNRLDSKFICLFYGTQNSDTFGYINLLAEYLGQ